MILNRKYILILALLSFLHYNNTFAQFFLYSEAPIDIEAKFTRQNITSSAKQAIFNILIIKNNSNRSETVSLNITVPEGWSVIGEEKRDITIPPLDSLVIPIRVAVGSIVKGDIGYSIIASLADMRGNTLKNEYCFVKIPRETELIVRYASRVFFLDPVALTSDFSVSVKNNGNREEIVNFIFDGNNILLTGERKDALYSKDITVPPYTDTLFTFRVSLRQVEQFGRKMFPLNAITQTIDTAYTNTLWFRLIGSSIKNEIPPNQKPLSMEFYAQGLLDADVSPIYSVILEGTTLFKGESEVYYHYRNFNSKTPEDFYLTNRMYIGGNYGPWNIEIGDSYKSIESSMSGRGGALSYNNETFKAELIAVSYTHLTLPTKRIV